MGLILAAPGRLMGLGRGLLALRQPLVENDPGGPPNVPSGTTPDAIPGLDGWWDGSTLANLMGPGDQPVSTWRGQCATIVDRSPRGDPITSFRFLDDGRLAAPFPHLSGTLGGVGQVQAAPGLLSPSLDPDQGFRLMRPAFDAGSAWTWAFVWSRPNRRQGSFRDGDPIALLRAAGITILQADSAGPLHRLVLFPAGNPVVLTDGLQRRHTHSVILRHVPSQGLEVWLDDTLVAQGVPNSMPASPQGSTLFLHDGAFMGGAQCWFHEAATWNRALTAEEIAALRSYVGRWHRGPRKGVLLLINGQSNAVNYALNDGAASLLAEGVGWYLGALASNILATTGNPTSYTMQSGHGVYQVGNGTFPGDFLHDPRDGSDPVAWQLGADGLAVQTAIQALPAEDRADVRAIVWPWSETDSLRAADELSVFTAAAARLLALERSMLGQPAEALPLIWWNAIPFGTAAGMMMHRRAVHTLVQNPAAHVLVGNPQTTDSNPRGAAWNEITGEASGGDPAHRDGDDNRRFARLAAPVVARAILAAGGVDSVPAMPDELPASGGPRIVHAYRQSDTVLVVTVQHDGGTDLLVPRQAATGRGFAVSDGDPAGGQGALIPATVCERINPTQLRLTLAQPIQHVSSLCGLHYPYGNDAIGRGNAITDDFAQRPNPPGWEIATHLGFAWSLNYPLAATFVPVPLADAPF